MLWVGVAIVNALVGDLWAVINPFATLAAGVDVVLRRTRAERNDGDDERLARLGVWPAAVLLLGFAWLELAHPELSSPPVLAWAIGGYAVLVVTAVVVFGPRAIRSVEMFTAYFGLLARIAPVYRDGEGAVRLRAPLVGLARLDPRPGTGALVFVALGSTAFDGLTRTRWWTDMASSRPGWQLVPVATAALLLMTVVVGIAFHLAIRVGARVAGDDERDMAADFVHSLVPIALGYAVAHYFSLLVFEGQSFLAHLSDPFGRGWNLFGTAGNTINYFAVTTNQIASVQAGAIVIGHIAGVLVAHDRAVALYDKGMATRTQYPLLALMVLYTVGGLALLLGG